MKFNTPEERSAYYKGKYEALKEKAGNTSSMIKQSVIDHTVRYVLIALFVVGGSFGTYYYVSNKVTETVTEIKQDVKDSIPHPIDSTKKWFSNGNHWWSKDDNKAVTVVNPAETVDVVEEKKDVSQDENKTGFFVNAKEKLSGLKFWEKRKENNKSKEK